LAAGIENSGTLSLFNSVVADNQVVYPLPAGIASAGGIHSNGQLLISHSRIANNYALYRGGGLWIESGIAVIDGSEIEGNSSSYGGGILVGAGAELTLTNSTIRGNSVSGCCGHYGPQAGYGAGLYNSGQLRMSNVTVSGNTAVSTGSVYDDVDMG